MQLELSSSPYPWWRRVRDPWYLLPLRTQSVLLCLCVPAVFTSSVGLFVTAENDAVVRPWCAFHNLCWSNLFTTLLLVPPSKPRQWMIIARFVALAMLALCGLSGLVLVAATTGPEPSVCVSVPASCTVTFVSYILFQTRHRKWFGLAA